MELTVIGKPLMTDNEQTMYNNSLQIIFFILYIITNINILTNMKSDIIDIKMTYYN